MTSETDNVVSCIPFAASKPNQVDLLSVTDSTSCSSRWKGQPDCFPSLQGSYATAGAG